MKKRPNKKRPNSDAAKTSREQRLRAALRENLARRKAQGRARAAKAEQPETDTGAQQPEQGEERDSTPSANQEK